MCIDFLRRQASIAKGKASGCAKHDGDPRILHPSGLVVEQHVPVGEWQPAGQPEGYGHGPSIGPDRGQPNPQFPHGGQPVHIR